MSSTGPVSLVGAAVCVAAAPYLARLTRTVPDRENAAVVARRRRVRPPDRCSPRSQRSPRRARRRRGGLVGAAAGVRLAGPDRRAAHRHRLRAPPAAEPAGLPGGGRRCRAAGALLRSSGTTGRTTCARWRQPRRSSPCSTSSTSSASVRPRRRPARRHPRRATSAGTAGPRSTTASSAASCSAPWSRSRCSRRGAASLKTALAFGPMLLFGALIVLAFDLTPSFVR